MIMTKSNFKI